MSETAQRRLVHQDGARFGLGVASSATPEELTKLPINHWMTKAKNRNSPSCAMRKNLKLRVRR